MRYGKLRPQGKVLDHWQLLHESDFEDTDTKLLLHLDNNVTDYATGKTVTNTNVTFSSTYWKFNTHSALFNGTSAYLTLADSSDWYFGSGNFTIDFRVRFNNLGTYMLVMQRPGPTYWGLALISNEFRWLSTDGGGFDTSGASITTGVWYHVALVRNGTTITCYVDGVSKGSSSFSGSYSDLAATLDIGWNIGAPGQYLDGYLDEFRIVKGTAKWTSNFTPPTAPYLGRTTTYPITSDRNTVLMISGEGVDTSTSIIDETGKTVTANGNAQIDTAQYKFGQSSILFDGTGDYLSLADSADWYFGYQPFTVDFWVRFNTVQTTVFVGQFQASDYFWRVYYFSGALYFAIHVNNVYELQFSTPWTPSTGQWYHIAVSRIDSGNTSASWLAAINGVQGALTLVSGAWNYIMYDYTGSIFIGGMSGFNLDGWLDDIRITKGLARWTSNFTPPLKTTALINGDTDEEYKLVSLFRHGGASGNYQLYCNIDTGSNYGYQLLYGTDSTIVAARGTNAGFWLQANNAVDEICESDILLYAKSGFIRTLIQNNAKRISGTTVYTVSVDGQSWNNTTQLIAALSLTADVTNGIGTGSKFLLYRKVK